ncbi:hypothetical protein VNI00_017951 [Paramarasmius palmivorus]|uniref:Uncharacterized protein n=1 Tax=Paramarasmius palmivorus TaxID=297713 RepID=A0AAW0B564_9AGAR
MDPSSSTDRSNGANTSAATETIVVNPHAPPQSKPLGESEEVSAKAGDCSSSSFGPNDLPPSSSSLNQHSESSTTANQTSAAASSAEGSTSGSTVEPSKEGAEQQDEEDEDDDEIEEGEGTRRGPPGNFDGARLQFLLAALPGYEKLPKGSKERELYLRNITQQFLEKFPVEEYPPPARRPMKDIVVKTPAELKLMTADERKSYRRKMERRNRGPEKQMIQIVKNWFFWKTGDIRRKESVSVEKFLTSVKTKMHAPRRRQPANVVMSHDDHRENVKNRSLETDKDDRLSRRKEAANKYLEELDETERKKVMDFIEEDYQKRVKDWKGLSDGPVVRDEDSLRFRRSFSNVMKHIIDVYHQKTGLNIVVMAGEDMDGQRQFDTVVLCSGGPHATPIDEFDVTRHDDFVKFYYRWLRDVREKTIAAGGIVPNMDQGDQGPDPETHGPDYEGSVTSAPSGEPTSSSSSPSSAADAQPIPSSSTADASPVPSSSEPPRKKSKSKSKSAKVKSSQGSREETEVREGDAVPVDKGAGKESNMEADDKRQEEEGEEEEAQKFTLNEALRLLEAGQPASDTLLNTLPYDDLRSYNMERNRRTLEGLGLGKAFNFLGEEKEKQKPRPKAKRIPKKQNSVPTEVRRSSRINTSAEESGVVVESDGTPQDLGLGNDSVDTDVLATLMDARRGFLEDDWTVKKFTDVVNSVTSADSLARREWTEHVSRLSEEFLVEHGIDYKWPEPPMHLKARDGFLSLAGDQVKTTDNPSPTTALSREPAADANKEIAAPILSNSSAAVEMDPGTHVRLVVEAYLKVEIVLMPISYNGGAYDVPYIRDFVTFLLHVPEGSRTRPKEFEALTHLWAELEDLWCVAKIDPKNVPKKARPDGFDLWFRVGRWRSSGEATPKTATLIHLRDRWWKWWSSANPEWRIREGEFILPGGHGDWEEMEYAGKDGLVLFLVALKWWYDRLEDGIDDGLWLAAVRSVYSTLNELITYTQEKYKESLTTKGSKNVRQAPKVNHEAPPSKRQRLA